MSSQIEIPTTAVVQSLQDIITPRRYESASSSHRYHSRRLRITPRRQHRPTGTSAAAAPEVAITTAEPGAAEQVAVYHNDPVVLCGGGGGGGGGA